MIPTEYPAIFLLEPTATSAGSQYKCLNPMPVVHALKREMAPQILIDQVEKANTFTIQHGPEPNTAYLLISNEDYNTLKDESSGNPDVNIIIRRFNPSAPPGADKYTDTTFERYTITKIVNVIGPAGGNESIFLLKLEDLRYWMKKIYCQNLQRNWVATNRDFDNAYLQENTTNGGSFYSVEDILTKIIQDFSSEAGVTIAYDSDATYDDYIHNVEFHDETVLDAIMKICMSQRLHMHINPAGDAYFASGEADEATGDAKDAIAITEDVGTQVNPDTLQITCEKEQYSLYDDRCDNDRPNSVYVYERATALDNTSGDQTITVPFLFQSDYLSNTSSVESILANVAARYEDIVKIVPKASYWRGYHENHEGLGFGRDKIIYSSRNAGMITVGIALELDQQPINYRNPIFPKYHEDPHGMWLYRFTLKEDWDSENKALSDIFRHSGEDTGYDEDVRDPFQIFQDLGIGDSGWCIELCDLYYAIQAPCYESSSSTTSGSDESA